MPPDARVSRDTLVPAELQSAGLPQRVPRQIGKYDVHDEIGRGTCGVVYRGFDPFVQRDVAIKVALQDAEFLAEGSQHERAFFAEARAAGMLAHPHIVSLYDAGVEGALSYIVMEYIDGQTLQALCRRGAPPVPVEQVVDIVFKCAKALDYAHSKSVLHRDIKPSNIMLTREGVPKLMDFSIAEIGAAGATEGVAGSPLYMSPEQIRRERPGPTSDLYSLGAVMYQLLTGEPPFAPADLPTLFRLIRNTPAPRVETLRPDAGKAVGDVVARLLAKAPDQRYASGGDLAATLTRLFDQLRSSDRQISRRENRDSLRRLHFFNGFSDEDIDEILNASTIVTCAPGEEIIREGAVDNAFFIIARGSAEVRKGGKRLHTLDKGDCFGEIGFLTAAKRTASVVATQQVLALKINATLMDQVSRDCQLRFYKVFTETLIYRLSLTSAKLSAAT